MLVMPDTENMLLRHLAACIPFCKVHMRTLLHALWTFTSAWKATPCYLTMHTITKTSLVKTLRATNILASIKSHTGQN